MNLLITIICTFRGFFILSDKNVAPFRTNPFVASSFSPYFFAYSRSLLLNQIPALPSNFAPTKKIERWPRGNPEGQECLKWRRGHRLEGLQTGVQTCDGSDSVLAEDLRAFWDVFTRCGGLEGGEKEGSAGATLEYTLADHVKS